MKKLFSLVTICCMLSAVSFAGNSLTLNVKGMHCVGCETKFKSAAASVKGIEEVKSVSAAEGSAVVTYDEKVISAEDAIKALAENSGFGVTATTEQGAVTAEGKPAACCMKGQASPACKKGEGEKCTAKKKSCGK